MNITKDMTPAEAANLLEKLEEGHQAAWRSTREAHWHSAEYEARFQNAAEVDGILRDIMRETVENGMRRPGEPIEDFAERAGSAAWLTDARQAGAETPAPVTQPTGAGAAPERPEYNQNELTARLLSDARTLEGQAYARAFSDTAATYVREIRERNPLPEPDRAPGAPHPDPFLAGRGWQVNEHGIYTRRAHAESQRDLEAGLWQRGSSAGRTREARYPRLPRPVSVTATPSRAAKAGVAIPRLSLTDQIRRAFSLKPREGTGAMTETTIRTQAGIVARIFAWIRRCQHELSARVHAAGDERARQHGWTVTETTGRFGFGARSYRDPRFEDRRRQLAAEAGGRRTRGDTAPAQQTGE